MKLQRQSSVSLVHCRSYVAMLMGMPLRWFFKRPIVFDMRGFWADEKVDARRWKRTGVYLLVKFLEKHFLKKASHVISLTQRAVDEMLSWSALKNIDSNKFSVISTCVVTDRFDYSPNPPENLVLGYVGGTQLWYDFPRVLGLFNALLAQHPNAKLHIVNKGEHDFIRRCLSFAEVPEANVFLEERSHAEMADVYKEFSFGVFFIRDFYSKKASMPTKLAEFMATGVPVITGRGIGDVDYYLEKYETGLLVDLDLSEGDLGKINNLRHDVGIRKRCRELAETEFSMGKAITQLNVIYRHLASQD